MIRQADPARRTVSAVVAALMLALSVAIPVMERGALLSDVSLEAEHDPARCADTHDHRICTQVGVNVSHAVAHSRAPAMSAVILVELLTGVGVPRTHPPDEASRSRAPPLV